MNTRAMNTEAKQIGDALDAAMKDYNGGRGMSQSELHRISGVPQPTISRTLKGKSIPETSTLTKLVAILGTEKLGKAVASIINNREQKAPTIAPLTAKLFALRCHECGHVFHKSFIDLESSDSVACDSCSASVNVADYYGQAHLAEFLKSIGATGIALRKR